MTDVKSKQSRKLAFEDLSTCNPFCAKFLKIMSNFYESNTP